MSSRTSKVPVDDDNSDEDADGVHDEGEEQVLGYQRQHQGGWGQDLRDEQQEHNEREQDRNTQRHLKHATYHHKYRKIRKNSLKYFLQQLK